MKNFKRMICSLLCAAMILGNFPVVSFAAESDGLCEHHVNHEECGYEEGTSDCGYDCAVCTESTETTIEPEETTEQEASVPTELEPISRTTSVQIAPDVELPDNEELFAYFTERELYGYDMATYGTAARENLNAVEQAIYDALKSKIETVAVNGGSTVFPVSNVSNLKVFWTNTQLGVSSIEDQAVVEEAFLSQFNLENILSALLSDCPFELYWYDKTIGATVSYEINIYGGNYGSYIIWDQAYVSSISFTFAVAADYSSGTNMVTTNVAKITTAKNNAAQVVANHANKSDYEKLVAYKDYICGAVSYNKSAAENISTPYGAPWQLIYVFDNDASTNVVCEGYSKAFQYLCDLSTFSGDTVCYSVSGQMDGGDHMWNIVTLDGNNYLVDVTNSDSGTVGQGGGLFLTGASGSAARGYTADGNIYVYDSKALNQWGTGAGSILNLAAENYDSGENGANIIASGTCGKQATWTLDDAGTLTISGTGETTEYGSIGELYGAPFGHDHLSTPWNEKSITSFVVEEGITSILGLLCWGAYNLTSVSLPDSLKTIGHCSFEECYSLTSITIPQNVTRIWSGAFWDCKNLTNITFTGDAPSINNHAFDSAVTATCYYPANNTTWTDSVKQNYGGTLTWVAYCTEQSHNWLDATCVAPKTCTLCGKTEGKPVSNAHTYVNGVCSGCGDLELHIHDGVEYTAWTSTSKLPSVSGHYCLIQDVVLTAAWTAPEGELVLCLNGHNVSGNYEKTIPDGSTMTLEDCADIPGVIRCSRSTALKCFAVETGGVLNINDVNIEVSSTQNLGDYSCNVSAVHNNGGTVNLNSGYISATTNALVIRGAWVYCVNNASGTFNMSGGTLYASSKSYSGDKSYHAHCISNSGITNLTGGTLTAVTVANSTLTNMYAYAIYNGYKDGTINLAAKPEISGKIYVQRPNSFVAKVGNVPYYGAALELTYYPYASFRNYDIVVRDVTDDNFRKFTMVNTVGTKLTLTCVGNHLVYDTGETHEHTWQSDSCAAVRTCSVCEYTDGEILGHNWSAATCTSPKTCTKCGVTEGTAGHVFVKEICSVCGARGGSCGANLVWALYSDGRLVITGSGSMEDYNYGSSPFYRYADSITSVQLPDGITSIGERAFDATFPQLAYIEIPTSVTHIRECAFGSTYTKVKLKYPGTMAQWDKISITSFVSYGKRYGAECSDGTIIYKGNCGGSDGLYNYVQYALLGDGTLKITGSGAMKFYKYLNYESCFSSDDKIKRVEISEGVTSIAAYAFKNCSNLTEVYIPASVTSISYDVFDGCTGLTDIYYGSNEKNWKQVRISSDGNELLANATIHYTDLCTAGHTWIDGDCTTPKTCSVCDVTEGTALGHVFTVYVSNNDATCTKDGTKTAKCDRNCGETDTVTDIGSTKEHTFTEKVDINCLQSEATCAAPATYYKSCVCGEKSVETFEYGDKLDHNWYDATCSAPRTCSGCGETKGEPDPTKHYFIDTKCAYCGVLGGSCGTSAFWTLDAAGAMTIYGSGKVTDYSAYNTPWHSNRSQIKTLTVMEGITHLGNYAFRSCTALESVSLPETMETIGNDAFIFCSALSEITLPKNLVNIGSNAFYGCSAMTEITVPASVVSVGNYAFSSAVKTIRFEGAAPEIAVNAFSGVTATVYYPTEETGWEGVAGRDFGGTLTWVPPVEGALIEGVCGDDLTWRYNALENTLIILGTGAMYDYTPDSVPWAAYRDQIKSVSLPTELTRIGDSAFFGFEKLTSLLIPEKMTSLGQRAFEGCSNITFYVSTQNRSFMEYNGALYDYYGMTLYSAPSVRGKYVPNYRTQYIRAYAFAGNKTITEVETLDRIYSIGEYAFDGCSNLKMLFFRAKAPAFGENAFRGVTATVQYLPNDSSWTASVKQNYGGKITWKACNIIASYQGSSGYGWELTADGVLTFHSQIRYDIPSGGGSDFVGSWYNYRDQIKHVVIPAPFDEIGEKAFEYCTKLETVTMERVDDVGARAFYGCTSLKSIYLCCGGAYQLNISDYAFYGCTSLEKASLNIRSKIGAYAFGNCSALKSIYLNSAQAYMDGNFSAQNTSFSGVTADVLCPYGVKTVTNQYGGKLTYKNVSYGTCGPDIEWSFNENTGTLSLYGTGSVSSYFSGSFTPWTYYTTEKIKHIVVGAGITVLPEYTFEYCNVVETVDLSHTLTTLSPDAFNDCYLLNNLLIPRSVTTFVSDNHFRRCPQLTDIYYLGTEEEWTRISNADNFKVYSSGSNEVDYTVHFMQWNQTTATCTQAGKQGYYSFADSSVYDYKYDANWNQLSKLQTVSALGHQWSEWTTVEATCMEDGNKFRSCQRVDCGETETEIIKATGHTHDAVVTAPTCTSAGYTTYTCHCGDTYKADHKDKLDHDMGDWTVVESATCTEDGSKRRACSRCDFFETKVVEATGHDHKTTVTAPTCTEDGYTTYTCHCGDIYKADHKDKLGHSFTEYMSNNDATCTEDGTKTAKCDHDCGKSDTLVDTGSALGHDMGEWVTTKEATCGDDGEQQSDCSHCDYFETKAIEATGHNHKAVVTAPTCEEDGFTTYICHCGNTYVDKIVTATGHSFNMRRVHQDYLASEATCTEKTAYYFSCTCGVAGKETFYFGNANGHDYEPTVIVPTCTESGYTTYTCHCGDSYVGDEKGKLNHDMGEWEVTKEPAIGVEGEKERSCKREGCTHTETETIPMLKWNVAFANMSLSNSLAMNFAFAQGNETDWSGCYAKITKTYADGRPDVVVTLPVSQWGKATIGGVPHYTISFQGIAAKEMGDEIHVCIYDADGEAVSNVWTDSALKYALRAYNADGAKTAEKRMLIDMLNYGAAAQQIFDYDAEHLVTAGLTEEQQAMATKDVEAKSSQEKGANYLGTNLSLESEIRINMAFKDVSEGMYAKVSFTNHAGRKIEEVARMDIEGSTGIVRVNQIAVADGRTMVTVTVHKADGSVHGSVVDSLEGYIARVIDKEQEKAQLYKKILMFADSTYNYKHG